MSDEPKSPKKLVKLSDLKSITEFPKVEDHTRDIMKAMAASRDVGNVANLMNQVEQGRLKMEGIMRPLGSMQKVYEDLEAQRKRLGLFDMKVPQAAIAAPVMPKLPPNPVVETNRKLEDIETKFEEMLAVMGSAAQIATDIQSHAVQFLEKFDKASEQTDHAARSAIRIAVLAIVISVITPFIPMGIEYIWPDKTVSSLEKLTQQIVAVQEADRAESERLIQELRQNNEQITKQFTEALKQRDAEVVRLSDSVRRLAEKQ